MLSLKYLEISKWRNVIDSWIDICFLGGVTGEAWGGDKQINIENHQFTDSSRNQGSRWDCLGKEDTVKGGESTLWASREKDLAKETEKERAEKLAERMQRQGKRKVQGGDGRSNMWSNMSDMKRTEKCFWTLVICRLSIAVALLFRWYGGGRSQIAVVGEERFF